MLHHSSRPTPSRRRASRALAGAATVALVGVSALHLAPAAGAADTVLPAATRYAPSAVADRVVLLPTADPTSSQTVSWRSTAETPRAQIIEAPAAFGDVMLDRNGDGSAALKPFDGTDYSLIRTVEGTTEEIDLTGAGNVGYRNRQHSVRFTGLKPNTRYSYRVGDGTNPDPSASGTGAASVTNWSAWEDFTTAADGLQPYSFVYFGDAQNHIASSVPRVFHQAMLDRPKAKVVLHAGDLINQTGVTGSNLAVQEKEWGEWFGAAGFANQTRNVIATPGNHEYNGSTQISPFWKPQFPLPENGPKAADGKPLEAVRRSTYFVDYQGVRYISLDSSPLQNGPVQEDVLAAQTAWLESVLKDEKRPKWTVVTFHHPVYAGTGTRNNSVVRDNWNPIFDRYGVDLVLQGHDHVYNRGNQVKDDDPSDPTKSHGTVYSISVSGGKMYELDQTAKNWNDNGGHRRVAAENIQLYQLIDVDEDTLTYQARLANGTFFDGYRVTKTGAAATSAKTVQDLDTDPDAARPGGETPGDGAPGDGAPGTGDATDTKPAVPAPTAPAPPAAPLPPAKGPVTARVTARMASSSVARNGRAALVVAVSADGRFVPGTVTVTDRTTKRTWRSRATLRGGLVTVRSPRLAPGRHRIEIAYSGTTGVARATAKATVRAARR